jgi:general stress protein 26
MNKSDLLAFLRSQKWAVEATVSDAHSPQAALIGFAITDSFELVFDAPESTRKINNLKVNLKVALVVGGWVDGDERTVQYEGVADLPAGKELAELKSVYFTAFPEGRGRENSPGLVYVRVKPNWVRYSSFNGPSPETHEFYF